MNRRHALSMLVVYLEAHRMGWDSTLFLDVNRLSSETGWAHGFKAGYALFGGLVALTVVWACCGLSARRGADRRPLAGVLLTGAATVVALALNQVVNPVVDRPRPFVTLPHVLQLLPHAADGSFPSDHAMIAGAFAGGLLMVHRRWGVLAVVLAVFLAFARVYAGLHYPTDVAAGLLLGALVAAVLVLCLTAPLARLLDRLAGTRLRPLITADRLP